MKFYLLLKIYDKDGHPLLSALIIDIFARDHFANFLNAMNEQH